MSSLNSSHQIKIIKNELRGDTLFVKYKRGPFVKSRNVLPLNNAMKYLKCANKLYVISNENNMYSLTEIQNETKQQN